MKKPYFVAIIMMIMLFPALISFNSVYAESTTVSAKVLNNNQLTLYHNFEEPDKIFYTSEGLYISTANGYEIYSNGKFDYSENKADDFTYLQGLITLKNGVLFHNNNQITDLNGFTAISAYGSTLYALRGDNEIYKFDYFEGKFSHELYPVASGVSKIEKIAAAENECIYTTFGGDGYTNVIHFNGTEIRLPREDIIDIDYNEKLFVLTHNRIMSYIDSYNYIDCPISGAKSFSVGDKVYILTRMGNIDRLALDLSPESLTTIVATGSDKDWFYFDPVGGTTRLKKIYVADRDLGRIAIINGDEIQYITGLSSPVAVATDNNGYIYVAHHGNTITRFFGEERVDKDMSEDIADIQVDYSNNLYCLTKSGKVIDYNTDVIIRENVIAFDYQGGWHYMTSDHIDSTPITGVKDFAIDVMGNIFAITGDNVIVSIIDGEKKEYIVDNASHLVSLTISKVDNNAISYGDLLLFDDAYKCLFVLDGKSVGSVNIKDLFAPPSLNSDPIERTEGLIGTVQGEETYMFTLPIEGEISHTLQSGDNVIICKDVPSQNPFVYCVCDDIDRGVLVGGYVYKDALKERPYFAPRHSEAKVNAPKTPVYKYPSIHSPEIGQCDKGKMLSLLPFAVTYTDEDGNEWYADSYPVPDKNRWYRIAYGDKEGYILVGFTSVTFFSAEDMPKTNATITDNATLYRYDEATDTYIKFEAIGGEISKDQRVYVDPPFDTSRPYTKIVFYREGYGTVDAECYVKTEYVRYDGVDIVKIIAAVIIAVAVITLVLVVVRKRKIARKPVSSDRV